MKKTTTVYGKSLKTNRYRDGHRRSPHVSCITYTVLYITKYLLVIVTCNKPFSIPDSHTSY